MSTKSPKKKAASQRDTLKSLLAGKATASDAPGRSQAKTALGEPPPEIKVPTPQLVEADLGSAAAEEPKPVPAVEVRAKVPSPSAKKVVAKKGGLAKNTSISLHPADEDRLDAIEVALRKKRIVGRNTPTSFLIKVALAAVDLTAVDLEVAVAAVREQDNRYKAEEVA